MITINVLEGKTFTSVNRVDESIIFKGSEYEYRLYHDQDCCESVTIEDICGELTDLENTPIVYAYETSDHRDDYDGSETYTFYHFRTIKGTVTIRWYGTSNGYYSESVSISQIT